MDSHGPKPFFDIAFTLLLVEEAKGAVNDSVAKNFLFFGCCCLLFLTWYFSTFREGWRLEHSGHSPTGPVAV